MGDLTRLSWPGFKFAEKRQELVDACIVKNAVGKWVSTGPLSMEKREKTKSTINTQFHAGIIQEEAEVKAGGEMKLVNAVRQSVVKHTGGLFFFPNVHLGAKETRTCSDTASRTGDMDAIKFDQFALEIGDDVWQTGSEMIQSVMGQEALEARSS